MRIALISDVHGNEVALEATIREIDNVSVDRIFCLGDVATLGPKPREVIGRLRDLGVETILGNHDEFLLEPDLIRAYTEAPVIHEAVDWCREQLSGEDLDFLRGFHRKLEVDLGSGTSLLLFHGTPRSHMEEILATTPAVEVEAMLQGETATLLAGGHTHLQMLRQHRGRLLVNPGSVGMPFAEHVAGREPTVLCHAEYAIVEAEGTATSIDLHRTPLETKALRTSLTDRDLPLREMLLRQYA